MRHARVMRGWQWWLHAHVSPASCILAQAVAAKYRTQAVAAQNQCKELRSMVESVQHKAQSVIDKVQVRRWLVLVSRGVWLHAVPNERACGVLRIPHSERTRQRRRGDRGPQVRAPLAAARWCTAQSSRERSTPCAGPTSSSSGVLSRACSRSCRA